MSNVIYNDCCFINTAVSASDVDAGTLSVDFNWGVFTNSEATISASAPSATTYDHCTYNWDKGGQTYPELSAIDKSNLYFTNYNLSSTVSDRSTLWSTSSFDTGFWNQARLGSGAWFFNVKGHIGAFYFGELSGAEASVQPLSITYEFLEPDIIIGNDANVNVHPLNIFYKLLSPTIYSYKDIEVDFVGVPRLGTSPLEVDFTAIVNLLGEIRQNYRVTNYRWQYDYDRDVTVSAATNVTTSEYTFSGYSGKQFSINLEITLEHRTTSATITRNKLKVNYITICGQQQPVRFEERRLIDIKNYLPDYLKGGDIYTLVEDMFENYLNTMYEGNRGYTYTEEDL